MPDAGIPVVLSQVSSTGLVNALEQLPGVSEVRTPDPDGVPDALTDGGVLITFRWSDSWLGSNLLWVQSYTAGVDQFPIERLSRNGTILTSAVGIHDVQVSEHAFGLLLGLTRGIAQAARQQVDRQWEWPRVVDLAGMTMGVLGLGVIGEAIARKAQAFGMNVIGTKRTPATYTGVAEAVFPPDQTIEVFRRSDVVVAVLPDAPDTRGLVGAAELGALDGGYFINVGRGTVLDEDALVTAMTSGTLRGAGLDVFHTEPLPESSPLWALPGVLLTPHVAGASPRYGERLAALFAQNLQAFQRGSGWINRVT
jgi:phosphoglycerate dehydrogenase-like enzyme